MAQSVWMAVPSTNHFKVVDMTGMPQDKPSDKEALARAPDGAGAIIAAVALAAGQQRRVSSICRFNMDILLIVD